MKGDVIVATIDTAAAWCVRKPIALAALVALVAAGLGGCETSGNLFGANGPGGPSVAEQAAPAQAAPVASSKVAIAPIIGAPDAVAKQLQTQLTSATEKQRIALAASPADKADFTLRGYIVAAREKTGTKVSYIWDVTDPAGKRVNRITGEEIAPGSGKDPWATVTPQITQAIADKTAASLATWLPTQKGIPVAAAPAGSAGAVTAGSAAATQTAAAKPVSAATTGSITTGSVSAVIPSVTGAPGDGGTALTGAIQRELAKSGVQLAGAGVAGAYKVEGKVAVGEGKDGKQPIQIDWHVKDPNGKKLGTVSQKNEVPQGSLDGAWGKTADMAASAAAQGILKLLPQQSTN